MSCSGEDGGSAPESQDPASEAVTSTIVGPDPLERAIAFCDGTVLVEPTPALASPAIDELSGLVASQSADVVWGHNDSGGTATIFAIGLDGSDRGAVDLAGATATDWEDITGGPGLGDAFEDQWIYVGDIGDNGSERAMIQIYAFAEPDPTTGTADTTAVQLHYPDGAHDAEVLISDPVSGDLFIVTKVWPADADDGATSTLSGVYRAANADLAAASGDSVVQMTKVADVDLGRWGQLATAGDITNDGAVVAIRTYEQLVMWPRAPGADLWEAFDNEPCRAPVAAGRQGEAFTFLPGSNSYLTISEGTHPPLNQFAVGK